jgi:hypothetical protein
MHRGLCNQQSPQASYQRGKISRSKCSKSAVLSGRRGAAGREGCSSGQQSTQELCWQSCCCGAVVAAAACRGAHSAGANVRRRGRSRVQRCLPPMQAQPTPWRWSGRCAIRPQASCSGNNSLRYSHHSRSSASTTLVCGVGLCCSPATRNHPIAMTALLTCCLMQANWLTCRHKAVQDAKKLAKL